MKWLKRIALAVVVFLVVAQAFRPALPNPAVDPAKSLRASSQTSAEVQPILDRSCRDCHSNQTVWPWYAQAAPVSWLLANDVRKGRAQLNFSEWATYPDAKKAHKLQAICHEVKGGDMPLTYYLPMHPAARLSDADRAAICAWTDRQLALFAQRGIKPAAHEEDGE